MQAKKITFIQTGWLIKGVAEVVLWGGDTGIIDMEAYTLIGKHCTKDNLLRCVNDNGFGVQKIIAAEIDVYTLYQHGHKEYNRTISVTHKHHTDLFLGWQHLKKIGAIG